MHANIIFDIVAFLFAISIHESAHAWSADRLGDPTARLLGRVTLNPVKHIDPLGTIIFPLLGALSGLPIFGWAKPTPVDTRRLRHPRRDDVLVSGAGPASNLLVAIVAVVALLAIRVSSPDGAYLIGSLPFRVSDAGDSLLVPVVLLCYSFLWVNVLLAVFNVIPVPPLDGSHMLAGALPRRLRDIYERAADYSFLLMILLLMSGIPLLLYRPVIGLFHFLLRI